MSPNETASPSTNVPGDSANFLDALGNIGSPEALFSLAATARALAAGAAHPGPFLVAHSILMLMAQRAESDAVTGSDWTAIRELCARLARFVDASDFGELDKVAEAWLEWTSPSSLQ